MEEKCATNKNTSSTINEKEDDLARKNYRQHKKEKEKEVGGVKLYMKT